MMRLQYVILRKVKDSRGAMNAFFLALSTLYIFMIFFYADSSAVSVVSEVNPFSLLHIPLYGILTGILLLALASRGNFKRNVRYALAAVIALSTGILDEYNQSSIPARDASGGDVLLDCVGIILVLLLALRFPPALWVHFFRRVSGRG